MNNIFKKNIYGSICYSMCVKDRIRDVKKCTAVEDLKAALKTQGLQKTVEKVILSRIRRLENG